MRQYLTTFMVGILVLPVGILATSEESLGNIQPVLIPVIASLGFSILFALTAINLDNSWKSWVQEIRWKSSLDPLYEEETHFGGIYFFRFFFILSTNKMLKEDIASLAESSERCEIFKQEDEDPETKEKITKHTSTLIKSHKHIHRKYCLFHTLSVFCYILTATIIFMGLFY